MQDYGILFMWLLGTLLSKCFGALADEMFDRFSSNLVQIYVPFWNNVDLKS